jgi:hypothetical protein
MSSRLTLHTDTGSPLVENVGRCTVTGRLRHNTRGDARAAIRYMHARRMREYRCHEEWGGCGSWHVGYLPASVIRGERTVAEVYAGRPGYLPSPDAAADQEPMPAA